MSKTFCSLMTVSDGYLLSSSNSWFFASFGLDLHFPWLLRAGFGGGDPC